MYKTIKIYKYISTNCFARKIVFAQNGFDGLLKSASTIHIYRDDKNCNIMQD